MNLSKEYNQVIAAIHNVQQDMDIISRGESADVGKYSYKYAGMPKIWLELKPLLKKHRLTIMQPPSSEISGDQLQTWVFHTSGEYAQSSMRLVITREDPQGMGSAITYARRYAVLSMLGLVTDEDNDATTQRKADGGMKKDWVRAYTVIARKASPDHVPTMAEFVNFMQEVYGKHPSNVLAKEHQNVLDTINAFDTKEKTE